MNPRLPGTKKMRVVTALTGVAACATGFLPTVAAQADTTAVRPENTVPGEPYWLNIGFKTSVYSFQVCGWHPGNYWRCTPWEDPPGDWFATHVGGNKYSWDRGVIDVYWNGGGAGHWDTCNTNGAYLGGAFPHGSLGHWSVSFWGPIGNGVAEC